MKIGVAVFPGSNCDLDTFYAAELAGTEAALVWHEERELNRFDCLILPGGFSYGDYLRTGSIARFAPLVEALGSFIERGGLVMGICNGFQILLEAGFLPGAMLVNKNLKFICRYVNLRVENNKTPFTQGFEQGQVIRLPIAHYSGNYYAFPDTLKSLEENGQVVLRYCDEKGKVSEEANPNGSVNNIAGIISQNHQVFGLMPHPERAVEDLLGSRDGLEIFKSLINFVLSQGGSK